MKTKEMILVALFASLTSIGAFIKFDLGLIPFTLQFFFCSLSGILLGARLGALSQVIYVALGLFGLPVFSKGGGLSYIFKPSFGFVIGFIFAAYLIGKLSEKNNKFFTLFLAQLVGLLILYAFGATYMYIIMNFYLAKTMTIIKIIKIAIVPFVASDIIKILLVSLIGVKIRSILKNI